MRRALGLITLALLAAAAPGLAACGSDGSGQPTAKLLSDTFSTEKPVDSGELDLTVDLDARGVAGLPSPLRIDLGGPFQSVKEGRTPKFDFDLGLRTKDGAITVGVISTGERGWVTLAGRAYTLGDEQFKSLAPAGGDGAGGAGLSLGTLGIDPRAWLVDVRDEGVETLAGAKVVHLAAGVDVPRLLEDLDGVLGKAGGTALGGLGGVGNGISGATRTSLEKAVKGARVDVWTGEKDHQLRRILVDVSLETAEQPDGKMQLDLAIANLNTPQAIGPPADPRPLSELRTALTLLARERSAGAGSGGAGATTTPAPAGGAQTYDDCVAAAGADLQAVQRCASLLGG